MNVLIIADLFGNNRQGYDLAAVLRSRHHNVRLVQFANESDSSVGNFGVKFTKPHGAFSKFHVLLNLFQIFRKSLFCRKDVVVCIGMPLLPIAALYKIVFRTKLVYYSLEYLHYRRPYAAIVRHLVDRYIDVEENRLKRVFQDLQLKIPSMVVYNLPAYKEYDPIPGKLRRYLKEREGATGQERIIIYAGSYQRYACIENIIEASNSFPDDVLLVLMIAWGLPERLKTSLAHCKIVPPQSGNEFFDWLSDADCALLPYEDKQNFNVQNCSPQKLFDCYLLGIPFLASDRPIIRMAKSKFPEAGVICDFLDVNSIRTAALEATLLKTKERMDKMRSLCANEFNYWLHADELNRFVCDWDAFRP